MNYTKWFIRVKLNDIVNKYNNTYNKAIKMNSVDAQSITYFNFHKESNKKDSKFEVNDYIRI